MRIRPFVVSVLSAAAVVAVAALAADPAHAKGDASGTLGAGGVARGDISMEPGETDRITADLDEGAALDVVFSAGFPPQFTLTDPDGAAVELGVAPAPRFRVRGFPIPRTGRYEFVVASADGSQGRYALTVRQKWARTFRIAGAGTAAVDVRMPSTGRIGCSVTRERGAPGRPRIVSLTTPGGDELLAEPVEPGRNGARLPPVETSLAGTYVLTIAAEDGTSAWDGKVVRSIPRATPAKLDLANGIDQVSFAADGVADTFRRCVRCHSWAASYAGVRAYARRAVPKMRTGEMPPDGPRVPADQIATIQAWIDTGFAR